MEDFATETIAARRESRNFLCLRGGSRQENALRALKAAVFKGDCPAAPIIRRMNLPTGGRFPEWIGLSGRVGAVRMLWMRAEV